MNSRLTPEQVKDEMKLKSRKYLSSGIMWSSALYFCLGILMIIIGNTWAMLPLNTPGIYQTIGYSGHINGIRTIPTLMFFSLGIAVLLSGILYMKRGDKKAVKVYSRIVAILQQPWIGFVFTIIAIVWLYMVFSPTSGLSKSYASIFNLDVNTEEGKWAFLTLMRSYPALEFLFFGLGIVAIFPLTMYSSAILLQDTGMYIKKKRLNSWQPYDERARMYAVKGLFTGGIFYIIVGFMFFLIGVVMRVGIDVFYPFIKFESYPSFINFYPWIPIAFGITCLVTSIYYYFKPKNMGSCSLAWFTAFVQLIIPFYGWFFGLNLMFNLYYQEKNIEKNQVRFQRFIGFSVALFSIIIPLFIKLMIDLNRVIPTSYEFTIDWSDLNNQVDGLAWTFTLVLILFYIVAGIFLVLESRAAPVEAQKRFRMGLATLFILLAIMQFVVLVYSVAKNIPGFDIKQYIPDLMPGTRGDNGWIFFLSAISVVYIVYCIEKYIKNSKRMLLTKIIIMFAIPGIFSILFSYIPAINEESSYKFIGYILMAIPAIGLIIGIIAIPIIYGKLAAQTSGEIRKNAMTILIGFLITFASIILHVLRGNFGDFPFNWLIFIILNIVGIFILIQGIMRSTI
ncbi:MAG: hypothetical protein ACTSYS_09340 [Promethearchaeota archaeon]